MLADLLPVGAAILSAAAVLAFGCAAVGPYVHDWMEAWPSVTLLVLFGLLVVVPAVVFWHAWNWAAKL